MTLVEAEVALIPLARSVTALNKAQLSLPVGAGFSAAILHRVVWGRHR